LQAGASNFENQQLAEEEYNQNPEENGESPENYEPNPDENKNNEEQYVDSIPTIHHFIQIRLCPKQGNS
jgi:hypothetical protein